MSPPSGQTPLIERPTTTSPVPSPAHEALKGNLVAAGESALSLKKKRSWIGSLRDAVHKGALQAKAAVDIFRSDQQKNETPTEPAETAAVDSETEASHKHASLPRDSMDSMTKSLICSTTPLRGDSEWPHKSMSKAATASLRQHVFSHPSRKERGSAYSVAGRPSSEIADIAGSEQFEQNDNVATHTRKSSVADSIVGSIRGIGRRAGKAKPTRACTKDVSPEALAETTPLPSSPIDIPAAAPSLDLDLGPAGFMTPMFGRSPERNQKERAVESKKLMDLGNITTGVPPPTPVLVSDKLQMQTAHRYPFRPFRPLTPRDLLKIQIDTGGPTPPPGPATPATPMPGTTFALEMDGANSEKSDNLLVFERSVTPSLHREPKELRKMRSLDAMADACAIAHASDELAQMAEVASSNDADLATSFSQYQLLRPQSPRRDNRSSETTQTLHSCPSDMPELTRHRTPDNARLVSVLIPDSTSDRSGKSVYEDPFDDCNAIKSGPPSPDRTIELPFRPKVHSRTKVEDTEHHYNNEESDLKVEIIDESNGESEPSTRQDDQSLLQTQTRSGFPEPSSKEKIDPFQTIASDDDTHMRAQQLLTSDIVLQNYDNVNHAASEGLSPHGGPLVPQMYHPMSTDQNTSPRSLRSRTTYIAGLGDTEYKFSFDNWLRESSGAAPPESEPATPHRRRMDMSLDSVSTNEERKTPQISPTTTTSDRTPSMGNRLDFELKHSERNTRYNALHPDPLPSPRDTMQSSRRGPPRFIFGASDETEVNGIHLANFESAYSGSRQATPQRKDSVIPPRVGSDDSVADSLKNAALEYSQLEERLAHVPRNDSVDIFADPTTDPHIDDLPNEGFNMTYTGPSTAEDASMQAPKVENESGVDSHEDGDFRFEFQPTSALGLIPPAHSSPLPTYPQAVLKTGVPSVSTAESPMTITGLSGKGRMASSDTLDRSLKLFMSSESGYKADESSVCEPNLSAAKGKPARYRGKGKRGGKPLSEISDNVG